MKTHFVPLAMGLLLTQACTSGATPRPAIEQSIYRPAPPYVNLKQGMYVRERERPLLARITDASSAITEFLLDIHNAQGDTVTGIRHVAREAQPVLRLPPFATAPIQGRFVFMTLYCWQSEHEDQLTFLVEWADITTGARYTDSYVFTRRNASWYFDRHGSVAPWSWTQTERYFQRQCPA